MGVMVFEPLTLHRNMFMYTVNRMSGTSCATLENLLTLIRTTPPGDPMPGTDTAAFGAGRQALGELEVNVHLPNTSVVDGDNRKILRSDAFLVR